MTRTASHPETAQDYIAGRLSDSDRGAFELQLLRDANLVRDVEESLRLREGLEILREQGGLVGLQHPPRRIFLTGFVRAAAAALVLIAVYLGFHYFERSTAVVAASVAELGASAGRPLIVAERHSFAAVRKAIETPDIALPTSGALELRALTPRSSIAHAFRVTLEEVRDMQESLPIGAARHLAPDADGFVAIYADASKLEPGDYLLIVEPDAGDNTAADRFAFKLTRATAGTAPSR